MDDCTDVRTCGHACVMYSGTKKFGLDKSSSKCCECLHTDGSAPTIYIDGLGEQRCPRWQFYCSACVCRCAPDGAIMWDAGKMKRVDVFVPGTRQMASRALAPKTAPAVPAVARAPAEWLLTARQTMQELSGGTDNWAHTPQEETQWECGRCTFAQAMTACEMCGELRCPSANDAEVAADGWACPRCTFQNAMGMPRCEICQNAAPPTSRPGPRSMPIDKSRQVDSAARGRVAIAATASAKKSAAASAAERRTTPVAALTSPRARPKPRAGKGRGARLPSLARDDEATPGADVGMADEVDACWNDCLAPPPAAEVRQAVEEAMIAAAVGETEEEAAVEVAPEEWVSVEGDGDLDGCVVDLGSLSAPLSRHGTTPRLPSTPPSATPPAVAGAAVPGAEEAEWDLLSLGGSEECTKKAALSEETEDWEAASEAASEAVSEALENRSFADTEAWETESELGATVDPDEGASGTSGTEDGHGTAMAAAVASCVLEPVSEGEACSSWAARLRAPAAAPPPARARRASNNAATALAGAAAKGGRWKPSEQLPKGTKPPPKRLVPRWGEVAFAYS